MHFDWEKEKPFLVYNSIEEEKIKSICLDRIVKIKELDQEIFVQEAKETMFELYGNLAKSYLLKDEERVVDSTRDKLVVANASCDKKTLFKRLLRYDILCKVTFPKADVKEFKNLISESLNNLKIV